MTRWIGVALAATLMMTGSARADELVAAPAQTQPAPTEPAAAPAVSREKCFADLSAHHWDVQTDRAGVATGKRFLDALKACDDLLPVAVERVEMYKVHDQEAKVFYKHKKFVMAAYGVLWAVLVLFVFMIFLRQRRLTSAIGDLEAKLARHADEDAKAASK